MGHMTTAAKKHLIDLYREPQLSEGRGGYLCLDRNERVTPYEKAFLNEFFAGLDPSLICSYPNPAPLIRSLSDELQIGADYIYPTNGSDGALRMIFQSVVRQDDRVVMSCPSYAMFSIYTLINGGLPQEVHYDKNLEINITLIEEQLNIGSRMLVLANPNQPTGSVLSTDQITALCKICEARDILMVIDEAYYPFYEKTAVPLVRDFKNLIITRSFSKWGGMAGLRLGYMVADPSVLNFVTKVRGAHEVNGIAIEFGMEILKNKFVTDYYIKSISEGRAVLRGCAKRFGLGFPECPANFQLISFGNKKIADELVDFLERNMILVKGKFSWPCIESHIRITLDNGYTMEKLERKICDYFDYHN
jgi:histidinol-phosphate aminotransferase